MANLDQQDLYDMKVRLRERAGRLRHDIRNGIGKSEDETHASIVEGVGDPEDDSFSNLIVDTHLSEIDRDVDELQRIDGALQRIASGSYGICVSCGEDIPRTRLDAEPTAARCVKCQSLYEKTHATQPTPSL
jgi:RNA polymerase-binding protein DksA